MTAVQDEWLLTEGARQGRGNASRHRHLGVRVVQRLHRPLRRSPRRCTAGWSLPRDPVRHAQASAPRPTRRDDDDPRPSPPCSPLSTRLSATSPLDSRWRRRSLRVERARVAAAASAQGHALADGASPPRRPRAAVLWSTASAASGGRRAEARGFRGTAVGRAPSSRRARSRPGSCARRRRSLARRGGGGVIDAARGDSRGGDCAVPTTTRLPPRRPARTRGAARATSATRGTLPLVETGRPPAGARDAARRRTAPRPPAPREASNLIAMRSRRTTRRAPEPTNPRRQLVAQAPVAAAARARSRARGSWFTRRADSLVWSRHGRQIAQLALAFARRRRRRGGDEPH